MTEPESGERDLLMNAAIDGELDAAGTIDMERRLAADPSLAAAYARIRALRQSIQTHAPREAAPEQLRVRVAALAGQGEDPAVRATRDWFPNWRRLAASIAVAAVLAGGVYTVLRQSDSSQEITRAVVAGHMRAQISGRAVDVASSDRHAVKPWLAGKVPLGTVAVDLEAQGFPLIGGRIDIVAGMPVPTLVYKRREHFISVSQLALTQVRYPAEPRRETVEGYTMLLWADSDRAYAAISDLTPAELDQFVALFRRAVDEERRAATSSRLGLRHAKAS